MSWDGCIVSSNTPLATRAWLVATLAITVIALLTFERRGSNGNAALREVGLVLTILTVLFLTRVAGQICVARVRPGWLPPMDEWNLTPYRFLLPAQLAILALMAWIDFAFLNRHGVPTERNTTVGRLVLTLSVVYAGGMAARYAVRMARRPDARWFGGTIPIAFHQVLAAYLFLLGSFHAGR